jgi:nucleoside-diphosphate-sugar epimerase
MNSLNGKTILLTGATGFIGTHLYRRLIGLEDKRLILVSRNLPAEIGKYETWITSTLDRLTPQIWQDHGIERIDVVFHLGAFTPKSSGMADSIDENYSANLLGTRALLDSLPKVPCKVVFSSTLDVYEPPLEGRVLTESSPIAPTTLYGASKLFCEHLVQAYARRTGCPIAILRYGHIYGPGESAYAKLIPVAIKALLNHEGPTVYGDGNVLRDFLFVDDAVEATMRAAVAHEKNIGPLNIVSGTSHPIRKIVEFLASLSPNSPPIKYLTDKPGGRSLRFSNALMHEALGDWPTVLIEEGLAREFAAFKQKSGQIDR